MISRATLFAKEGFRSYFRVVLQPMIAIAFSKYKFPGLNS